MTDNRIPAPPDGFELMQGSAPPPPPGFELVDSQPSPKSAALVPMLRTTLAARRSAAPASWDPGIGAMVPGVTVGQATPSPSADTWVSPDAVIPPGVALESARQFATGQLPNILDLVKKQARAKALESTYTQPPYLPGKGPILPGHEQEVQQARQEAATAQRGVVPEPTISAAPAADPYFDQTAVGRLKTLLFGGREGETYLNRLLDMAPNLKQWLGPTSVAPAENPNDLTAVRLGPARGSIADVGVVRGASRFGQEMTTPRNLAILAATDGLGSLGAELSNPAIQTAISAYFSGDMLGHAISSIPEIERRVRAGDYDGATEVATESGLSAVMGYLAGRHAVEGGADIARKPGTVTPEEAARILAQPSQDQVANANASRGLQGVDEMSGQAPPTLSSLTEHAERIARAQTPAGAPALPEAARTTSPVVNAAPAPEAQQQPTSQAPLVPLKPATDQEPNPQAPYEYAPLEAGAVPEGKKFYHGTQSNLTNIAEAEPTSGYSEVNLYGPGLYLTDNPNVASGYARTRTRSEGNGKVLFSEIPGAKLFDLEKPLPANVLAIFNKQAPTIGMDDLPRGITGTKAFEEMRDASAAERISAGDMQDVFAEIADRVAEMGYDGWRHEGGKLVGKKYGSHNVAILFPDWEKVGTLYASRRASVPSVPRGTLQEPSAMSPEAVPPPPAGFELTPAGFEPTSELPGRASNVRVLPTDAITVDPSQFQWRSTVRDNGLEGVTQWNDRLAGALTVWQDPQSGKVFLVDGHHRLDLAKRLDVPEVKAEFLAAPDAKSARIAGALKNIAEGNGSVVDAAIFFRETGLSDDALRNEGVSLSGPLARDGMALSNLSQPVWNQFMRGDVPQSTAVAVGRHLTDPAQQDAMLRIAKRNKLAPNELAEMARWVKESGNTDTTTQTLFGDEPQSQSNAIARARMSVKIGQRLAAEKNALRFVSNEQRAELLSRAGNIIDVAKSGEASQVAAGLSEVFQRLSTKAGPVAALLDDAARRITEGEKAHAVEQEIYPRVIEGLRNELSRAGGSRNTGVPEAPAEPAAASAEPESTRAASAAVTAGSTLPGFENVPAERAAAAGEAEGQRLSETIQAPPESVSRAAGVMERESPLFRESEAGGQANLGLKPPPGPGAQNVDSSVANEPGNSNLNQITDAIGRMASQKASPAERMRLAGRAAEMASRGRSTLASAWAAVKANAAAAWDWYRRPAPWTDFKDLTGKYQGALQYSDWELQRFSHAIKRAVPDKVRREAITNYIEADGNRNVLQQRAAASRPDFRPGYEAALELTPEERTLADNIRNFHDAELKEAIKAGILEHGLENYVQHLWKKDSPWAKRLLAEINFSALQPNPSFAKQRVLGTYFDGEQAGFLPIDKDVAFLTAVHHQAFAKAVASRAYIKSLLDGTARDGRPLAAVSGGGQIVREPEGDATAYLVRPGQRSSERSIGTDEQPALLKDVKTGLNTGDYVRANHPALRKWKWVTKDADGNPVFVQGDMLLHPDIAKHVENALGTSAIRRNAVGRFLLTGTRELKQTLLSFSAFHQTTEAQHALFHKVNPFTNLPELNLDNAQLRALVDHGLMVSDFDGMQTFTEGVGTGGLVTKIPGAGPAMQAYTDYLFKSYIPRLKAKMAMAVLERNTERYGSKLSRDQILEMTANQANSAFGELNYKILGRQPTMQDALRLTLLAPDFLEARARFVGQALKPYGREQLAALVRGAAWMYTGARIANQILDGDPHWDKPFSVIFKGSEFAARTIQGDVLHLVTDPRNFVFHRTNPTTTRTAIEWVTGRDELGRKRDAADQLTDFLRSHVPIPGQAFVGAPGRSRTAMVVKSILQAVGVSERRYQTPAESKARDFVRESMPAGVTALPQSPTMRKYRGQIANGELDRGALDADLAAGKITVQDRGKLLTEAETPQLQRDFKRLSLPQALEVWEKMSAAERNQNRDALERKSATGLAKVSAEDRQKMRAAVDRALRR